MANLRWTEAQTMRALYLYFQLPFGQIHRHNPDIIALALALDRTPSSVAMKLANFASLDPKIVESGRKGLSGASALDRKLWDDVNQDWTKLIVVASDVERMDNEAITGYPNLQPGKIDFVYEADDGVTSRRAEVEQRIGQAFFRRAVLANFNNACCITGILVPKLLIASHISPWRADIPNRHNPRNGLCLSATFDRAFDAHLLTVTPDLRVKISPKILESDSKSTRDYFSNYEGRAIHRPSHIMPDPALLEAHGRMLN